MQKSLWISAATLATLMGGQYAGASELIYGFNSGDATALDGFTGNSATVSASSTTGVTEGNGALVITNRPSQTYGGALVSNPTSDLLNATSFSVDITIATTPVAFPAGGTTSDMASPVYLDLVPIFFSSDGEIDPNTSLAQSFINLGGVAPSTATYTNNLAIFKDPDGVLTVPSTPGAILLADQAYDLANGFPADAITGFQLTVEHGEGVSTAGGTTPSPTTTLYLDNLTVPSVAVPEPASIGLLGMAGAFFMKRRKH